MGGDKFFLQYFELSFTAVVCPMIEFPFFIEFEFAISDKLIVIECAN